MHYVGEPAQVLLFVEISILYHNTISSPHNINIAIKKGTLNLDCENGSNVRIKENGKPLYIKLCNQIDLNWVTVVSGLSGLAEKCSQKKPQEHPAPCFEVFILLKRKH